ncbi:MAG: ribonuclease [Comamonadaceae bacterium]|nr:ribonuclease [Comamonadaceae bacterium]
MAGTFLVQARSSTQHALPESVVASVALTGLPVQGREVLEQIHQGGPFRYEKDGTVFGNRERLLPGQKRGYYREYTVPTPGLRHRGARRIVCGGAKPQAPDACYYTEDHYSSFRLIVQ